jgi:hypothetical protein
MTTTAVVIVTETFEVELPIGNSPWLRQKLEGAKLLVHGRTQVPDVVRVLWDLPEP